MKKRGRLYKLVLLAVAFVLVLLGGCNQSLDKNPNLEAQASIPTTSITRVQDDVDTFDSTTSTGTPDPNSTSLFLAGTTIKSGTTTTPTQRTGIRFLNVTIPKGATNIVATLTFKASADRVISNPTAGTPGFTIYGINENNTADWTTTGNLNSRPVTVGISYTPSSWLLNQNYTYDVSNAVNTIVNGTKNGAASGWVSGNAMAFRIDSNNISGKLNAYGCGLNGTTTVCVATDVPRLNITYTPPGTTSTPKKIIMFHNIPGGRVTTLENKLATLNGVPADGFVITTLDISPPSVPGYGTERFTRKQYLGITYSSDYFKGGRTQGKGQLGYLPQGITKDVYIEVFMDSQGSAISNVPDPIDLFGIEWGNVITNFGNLALAAKQMNDLPAVGGVKPYNFKGIFIDNEDYGKLFRCRYSYNKAVNLDTNSGNDIPCTSAQITATRDKMRQHGKAIADAILTNWPTAVIMVMNGPYIGDNNRGKIATYQIPGVGEDDRLEGSFFAGMVESINARPGAHAIVSGNEDYYLKNTIDSGASTQYSDGFKNLYDFVDQMGPNAVTKASLSWMPQALRSSSAWTSKVDNSFGVYSHEVGPQFPKPTYPGYDTNIYTNLTKPKTYLQNAKCNADEFVWFYIENDYEPGSTTNAKLLPNWYLEYSTNTTLSAWKTNVFDPARAYTCP